jgi:hypothetical protein
MSIYDKYLKYVKSTNKFYGNNHSKKFEDHPRSQSISSTNSS